MGIVMAGNVLGGVLLRKDRKRVTRARKNEGARSSGAVADQLENETESAMETSADRANENNDLDQWSDSDVRRQDEGKK